MTRKDINLALCFELPSLDQQAQDYVAPEWLPMIPAGAFSGRDGRSWVNADPAAIIARSQLPIPFDVEHSTELLGPQGLAAPARGWIVELADRSGEVYARVEWNEEGLEILAKKEYRFYSPAFSFDRSGNVMAMASAGLTNKPNLYTPALNSEESTVPLPEKIAQALGLQSTASDDDAVSAISALKTAEQVALNRSQSPDPTKFIPIETHTLALNRAESAEGKLAEKENTEVESLVDKAVADGKVAPANKGMYLALCRTQEGRDQFKAFVSSAPKIVTAEETNHQKPATGEKLSSDELALCRQMNVSPEDFLAAKAKNSKE
jgi:phage I-like protein